MFKIDLVNNHILLKYALKDMIRLEMFHIEERHRNRSILNTVISH